MQKYRGNAACRTIGEFTLQGPSETLGKLQNALKVSLQRIADAGVNDDDPILGLRAFAARAFRMTDAQHWKLVKGIRPDGSEVQGYQFQADPEENKALDAERARTIAHTKHFNARLEIEACPFPSLRNLHLTSSRQLSNGQNDSSRKPDENDEADDFSKQWDKRAIAMAAALAARDYAGENRRDVFEWARAQLKASITDGEPKHPGSEQVQYSEAAIAALASSLSTRRSRRATPLMCSLGSLRTDIQPCTMRWAPSLRSCSS